MPIMAHNSVPWLAILCIYKHQDTRKPKRHIYQDEPSQLTAETDKPPKKPRPNPPSKTEPIPKPVQDPQQPPLYKRTIPTNVQINIACDEIATEMTRIALGTAASPIQQTILTPPYEGSHAMLQIGKSWITAHYKKAIYNVHQTPALRTYMLHKYSWSTDTIKTVNWASINSFQRNLPNTK